MSNSVRGTRPIFAFLGVTNSGTDADTNVLQERLNKLLSEGNWPVSFKRVGELLSITLVNPDFCFYVTLVKNENGELPDWADMAKNFGLQWDKRPVTASRLQDIIDDLGKNGKFEYYIYREIGFTILNELEKFTQLKVFTIPSFRKRRIYTARHSWAIRALQRGMRIEYVSKILGHASVKQTEVYARVMNIELDKAMEIFNRPLVPFG